MIFEEFLLKICEIFLLRFFFGLKAWPWDNDDLLSSNLMCRGIIYVLHNEETMCGKVFPCFNAVLLEIREIRIDLSRVFQFLWVHIEDLLHKVWSHPTSSGFWIYFLNKTMGSIVSTIVQNIKNAHSSPIDGISMAAKKLFIICQIRYIAQKFWCSWFQTQSKVKMTSLL